VTFPERARRTEVDVTACDRNRASVAGLMVVLFSAVFLGCREATPSSYTNRSESSGRARPASQPAPRQAGKPWVSDALDLGSIIDWGEEQGPAVGTGPGRLFAYDYAVERWQDGQKENAHWERWTIKCQDRPVLPSDPPGTWCDIERLLVFEFVGTRVGVLNHSTFDGSLKVLRADWDAGALDLRLIYADGSSLDVELRLGYDDGNLTRLRSFRGVAVTRDATGDRKLHTWEYRLAEYSYTLNVPVTMRGRKSGGAKLWNELITSLTPEDQRAWQELKKSRSQLRAPSPEDLERALIAAIPDYDAIKQGKRTPTELEEREINRAGMEMTRKMFADFFAKSKLSAAAQQRMIQLLMRSFPN